jgi:hypothetical protein
VSRSLLIHHTRAEQASAREELQELTRLHAEGRQRMASVWYPLYVFGVIYLGVAPLAVLIHRDHLAPYFLVALCVGSVLTARHYRHRSDVEGVQTRVVPWLATSIVMTVSGGVASVTGFSIGSEFLDTAGPFLVVASFFLAFAIIVHSRLLLVDAFAMVLICEVAGSFAHGNGRVALQASLYGVLLLGSARLQQMTEDRAT